MARSSFFRLRVGLLVGIALVALAFLLFPSLRDWPPPKRKPLTEQKVEVTVKAPFELAWGRRYSDPFAPALRMFVPVSEFGQWLGARETVLTTSADGPPALQLLGLLPDSEALSSKALDKWCPSGPDEKDCNAAVLNIVLWRDLPERADIAFTVMDKEEPPSRFGEVPLSGPYRKWSAFWVKDSSETGRLEFVGWECTTGAPPGARTTDIKEPLLERDRCFEPGSDLSRRWPALWGYERLRQLTACSAAGGDCKLYFPFRGRLVEVLLERTRLSMRRENERQASEPVVRHAFLAAWQYINRLYGDTRVPPPPATKLARAGASLQNCRELQAFARTAREKRDLFQLVQAQCGYALQLATLVQEERPLDAAELIVETLSTPGFRPPGRWGRWYAQAAVEAIDKSPQRETALMARAQQALARQILTSDHLSEDGRARKSALLEAARLADATIPATDQQASIYRELRYGLTEDADEMIQLMERWQDSVRKERGLADPGLREPTYYLCSALLSAKRHDRLKDCADTLLPLWIDSLDKEPRGAPLETLEYGVSMLRWYAAYGLTQNKPGEVLPSARKLAELLEPRFTRAEWVAVQGPDLIKWLEQRAVELEKAERSMPAKKPR